MSRQPGALIEKDPDSVEPYTFDWTLYLAELGEDAEIATSTFTVDVIGSESPAALEIDDESLLTGNLKAHLYLTGGTVGVKYRVTNHIITNTSPVVEDDRSVVVKVVQR